MAHFRRIVEDRAGPILLLGRLLLAWLFVHEGLTLAGSLDAALSAMAKLGVAAPLALAVIALQIAAGTALAIGLGSAVRGCGARRVLRRDRGPVPYEVRRPERAAPVPEGPRDSGRHAHP